MPMTTRDTSSSRPICPDAMGERELYAPGSLGYERKVAERMAWWRKLAEE